MEYGKRFLFWKVYITFSKFIVIYKFLLWSVVRWTTHDDGDVDFYFCGKQCGQTFIHRWMMR